MKRRMLSLMLCLLLALQCAGSLAEELSPESVELTPEGWIQLEEKPLFDEAPALAEPTEGAPQGEASSTPGAEATPEAAPARREPVEEAPVELSEGEFFQAALGSAGVQYAGVAYLSQAAFNSMGEDVRAAYVRWVDEITGMLDEGVPLYDVVFALYEDGDVGVHFVTPLRSFSGGEEESAEIIAVESSPLPETCSALEACPALEALPAAEAVAVAEAAGAAELAAEEAPAVRSENVERIEGLKRPAVRVRSVAPEAVRFAAAEEDGGGALEELREQYERSKEYFRAQLMPEDLDVYAIAEASLVDAGMSGFECEVDADSGFECVFSALSALMDSYPWLFDWSDGYVLYDSQQDEESGTCTISISMDVSNYYSEDLERRAQEKAEALINAALSFARRDYPHDLPYGMIRYFDQWLCAHNYYNTKGMYPSYEWGGNADRIYYYCHSSYGTLLEGYGVCESYAKAMSRLMDAAGIPNLYAIGVEHAWNNAQMVNGDYYLVDSTWNDKGKTSRQYLLSGRDSKHRADGKYFNESRAFEYPTLPSGKYSYSRGPLTLERETLCLRKGESAKINLSNSAYKGLKRSWKSSDTKVVKVKGDRITAVGPGEATVTLHCAGKTAECAVSVYQVSGLSFDENGASSLTRDYAWGDDEPEPQTFRLTVAQKGYLDTAENIDARRDRRELSVSSSKKSVATASATLTGDAIELTVTPVGAGDATIKVGFGGKTATLKLRVRRALKDEWFELEYERIPYSGKARTPKVSKTALAPRDLKFKLRYAHNTNAGEATVSIVGKGNYGALEKRYTIEPVSFDADKLKITEARAVYYSGAPQGAGITVKLGRKKLKAGTDYELLYDGSPAAPTEAGTYAVTIQGRNYAGTLGADAPHSFTIAPTPLSKLKLTLKKTSIRASGSPVTAEALGLKLKYGKREIPANEYEIRFRNGAGELISAPSEPGSYTVVIVPTGKNIAADKKTELTRSFKIKKK